MGLLPYDVAIALAHLFMMGHFSIQARIVRVDFDYSYKITEIGVGPTIDVHSAELDTVFTVRDADDLGEEK